MKFTSIIAVLAFAVSASATEPTPAAATPATPAAPAAKVEAKKEMPVAAANSASGDATKAPAKKGKKKAEKK